eukprot:1589113-Amphidinium_carterae.1
MAQQVVEVKGNGSESQYIGAFPANQQLSDWMRRFAEKQLRVKNNNAQTVVSMALHETRRYMPEIPSALLVTMCEAELTNALNAFSAVDSKCRRMTGLNFEDPKGANTYKYEEYIDVVVRPILGDRQGLDT